MRRVTVSLVSIAAGWVLVAGSAHAGLTETVTIVNDYDFRGISQSAQDDASNVEFGDATSFEMDLYAVF